jgi:hypothetical protein
LDITQHATPLDSGYTRLGLSISLSLWMISQGAVYYDFECCYFGRGSGDVAGVDESVAAYGQPDALLFFLVRFVIADYFSVSDLSVFWDIFDFDKETCVGARNVPHALE